VSGIQILTATSGSNSNQKPNTSVSCPAGKTVIGGGGDTSRSEAVVSNSAPTGLSNGKATGWSVDADDLGQTTQSWTVTVYVICATDQ
jgi:hypothetical protein